MLGQVPCTSGGLARRRRPKQDSDNDNTDVPKAKPKRAVGSVYRVMLEKNPATESLGMSLLEWDSSGQGGRQMQVGDGT